MLATVAALCGLIAHTPAADAATHRIGTRTFIVGNVDPVDTLNPFVGVTNSDYEVYQLIYDNLSDYGQNVPYGPAPRLATSWTVSKNRLVWTFHIRHGVRWSDGVPLTAADVAYTFKRVTVPNSVEFNNDSNYVQNITSVRQTGRYTVVMTVDKPTPSMAELIVPILPEHIWEHIPERDVTAFTNPDPVGSGPYIVTSFVPNESLTLRANTYYWGGRPGISKLVFQLFDNPSAEAFALENGSIDFAEGLTYPLFNSLRGRPGVTLVNANAGNFDELAFNNGAATVTGLKIGNGNPALLDINVRHAISDAIDQQEIIRKVFLGYASAGTSVIPPMYSQLHYNPPPSLRYHHDPALSRRILSADGWKLGPGGIRVKDGKQLALRLFIRSDSPTEEQEAPYLKDWLQAIGIKVELSFMSDDQLTNAIGDGDYDMFVWGWGVEPNPNFQLSVFTCGQRSYGTPGHLTPGWSDSFYCNKRYDRLYNLQQTLSGKARERVVLAMQRQLYVDDPYSVLYYDNDDQAYRSDLFTSFAPQPDSPTGLYLFQEVESWSYRCIRPVGTTPSLTDHNIGCEHTTQATPSQLAAAGVTGPPVSGETVMVIIGLLCLGGVTLWVLAGRRDAALADERE